MRSLLVALVVVVAVLFAPGPAHAQDSVADPSLILVPVGVPSEVQVGLVDEVLILEQDAVFVEQIGPQTLMVTARRPGGRAVVMLREGSEFRTMVLRGESRSEVRGPSDAVHGTYLPAMELGGSYLLYQDGPQFPLTMYHWGSWSQLVGSSHLGAYAGVETLPNGDVGLSDLSLAVTTPRWGVLVGDWSLQMLDSFQGFTGFYTNLRGINAEFTPGRSPTRLGVFAGAGRSISCCRYFAPDELLTGGATFSWGSANGIFADALAGIQQRGEDNTVSPVARASFGYRDAHSLYSISSALSGSGVGVTAQARSSAMDRIRLEGDIGVLTPGFKYSTGGESEGLRLGGFGAATYAPTARFDITATLRALHRAQAELDSWTSLIGAADLSWRPVDVLRLGARYSRLFDVRGGERSSGDGLGGNIGIAAAPGLYLGLDGSGYFFSNHPPDVYLGSTVSYGRRGWFTTGSYRLRISPDEDGRLRHSARLDTGVRSKAVDWRLGLIYSHQIKAGQASDDIQFDTDITTRWRRFLEVGVGSFVSYHPSEDRVSWGANAFWTLRPTALPKAAGGLGFRGSTSGVVYLDENLNGVRDEGEQGIPSMTIRVDGGRIIQTDEGGAFHLAGLASGTHSLSLDRQSYHASNPPDRTIEVAPLKQAIVDFGLTWGGRIQGVLYVDLHGDQTFDNGDPTVPTEVVSLRSSQGVVFARSVATGGRFAFTGLREGEYTVMVDAFGLPEGYTPVDDLEPNVFVEEGKPLNVYIRLHANRAIGGVVWDDQDRDGRGDGKRDLGIGGAEVYLSTGEVTRTGPDGSFLFRDLPPGAYAVRTELSTEARVVVLPVEPKEILDLSFVLPRGTRPPERNVGVSPKAPDSVAGLVLEAPMTVLPQGVALQVTATAVLSNGETREVTTRANWQTSDPGVLSVGSDGKVRGTAAGTAGVTAEWKGGVGDPLTFEVLGSPLERITVSPVGLRMNPGNTADLRVDVVDRSGRGGVVTPVAVWTVADPRIARIDADGRLKALKDGITTVQARIGEAWSPPLEIQVITAEVTALSIENLPARMPEGATVQLKATGYDTRLEVQNVTESVTWASSDPAVVRVEPDGRIIAVGRGTAQITASIGSLFTRSRTVFVTNTPPLALEVVPPGMTLSLYDLQKFRVTATFEDGSKGAVTTVVEWLVSGTAVLVRPDGVVVPREPGTATIRARYLGVESSPVTVTVEAR